jgi:hypothetical protein
MGAESLASTGIRSPERPARTESLYRLHSLWHNCYRISVFMGREVSPPYLRWLTPTMRSFSKTRNFISCLPTSILRWVGQTERTGDEVGLACFCFRGGGNAVSNGTIVQPSDEWTCSIDATVIGKREPQDWERNVAQCRVARPRIHIACSGIERGPPRLEAGN